MDFVSELEARQQLARYLKGELTLNEFQDWFVPQSWNFHQASDPSLQKFVSGVELALAEFGNGDWSENELRQLLNILRTNYELEYRPVPSTEIITTRTASSNVSAFHPIRLSPFFDKEFVAESA